MLKERKLVIVGFYQLLSYFRHAALDVNIIKCSQSFNPCNPCPEREIAHYELRFY